jgi:hypothetical protein
MGENEKHRFDGSRAVGASTQVRCEAAFGATEHTLDLPTPAIFFRGKVALHLSTVRTAGDALRAAAEE